MFSLCESQEANKWTLLFYSAFYSALFDDADADAEEEEEEEESVSESIFSTNISEFPLELNDIVAALN